jgi:SNF2 family DNA or RNA helicase
MGNIRFIKEPSYLPKHMAFPYQQQAFESVRDLEYSAIFHEQGLGKTKIAIDLTLYWLEKGLVDTVVFLLKKTLIANWTREFKEHTSITPRILSQNKRQNYYVFNSPARVIFAHYEVVKSEIRRLKLFLKTRDVAAILDESAKIKNPDSGLTKILLEISPFFKRRVIMTGTPVANRPYDLWSQIRFLDQGKSLGSDFADFKARLDLTNKLGEDREAQRRFEEDLSGLHAKIARFSVRETKAGKVIELPQKVYRKVYADWETRQRELYETIRLEERAFVIRHGIPEEDKSDQLLKRLLRLVQVAANPALIDDSYSAEPGKLPHLHALISEIAGKEQKAIVWTSFTKNADFLKDELHAYGARKIHGKMNIDDRNTMIEIFLSDPECRVLVATPGAAKEGLTLTVANHVIFYDRGFSLDDYVQAQDRIHRISQKEECFVYNFIMPDSIDEWVDSLLAAKQLAAQLAQGDISKTYYRSAMSYAYGEMLKQVLNIEVEENG